MNKKTFRILVVAGFVTYLIHFFLPIVPVGRSPEAEVLRNYGGFGLLWSSPRWLPWALLLGWAIASVGLFIFRPWGRILFACLYAFVLLYRLSQGVSVALPLEGFFGEIVSLIDGAILALAFTSFRSGKA